MLFPQSQNLTRCSTPKPKTKRVVSCNAYVFSPESETAQFLLLIHLAEAVAVAMAVAVAVRELPLAVMMMAVAVIMAVVVTD